MKWNSSQTFRRMQKKIYNNKHSLNYVQLQLQVHHLLLAHQYSWQQLRHLWWRRGTILLSHVMWMPLVSNSNHCHGSMFTPKIVSQPPNFIRRDWHCFLSCSFLLRILIFLWKPQLIFIISSFSQPSSFSLSLHWKTSVRLQLIMRVLI